jgi:ribosomal-protein-alanine N-acetyltransferase
MFFDTARLKVRPWTLEDTPAALAMYGDPEVMRYLGRDGAGATIESEEEMRVRLARAIERYGDSETGYIYGAVESLSEGAVIGTALLKPLELSDGSLAEDEIEIGWHLAKAYWRQGFGTEIGVGLIKHGLRKLGLSELHAIAYPANVASIRIMQKIGMEYMGSTNRYYGVVAEHYLIRA